MYILRIHEEYNSRGKKLYICFVDLEKGFDRIVRKVLEWAMRKKRIQETCITLVKSLYEGANTRVRVNPELSEEFVVKVGMHQVSVLSDFLFAVVFVVELPQTTEDDLRSVRAMRERRTS